MTPIVSPWFIYLLSILDGIRGAFIAGVVVLGVITLASLIYGSIEGSCGYDEEDRKKAKAVFRKGKKFILPLIITLLIAICIPPKKIVIAMYVAKFVTTDNITKAIEAGGNFKDDVKEDIIDIIEAMKGEESESNKKK